MIPEVTDLERAFGSVAGLPKWEDIPDEFKSNRGNKWTDLASRLFYAGAKGVEFKMKDGLDFRKFVRFWQAHAGSFEPKHEHKLAGLGYLMSQWFDDFSIKEETDGPSSNP